MTVPQCNPHLPKSRGRVAQFLELPPTQVGCLTQNVDQTDPLSHSFLRSIVFSATFDLGSTKIGAGGAKLPPGYF